MLRAFWSLKLLKAHQGRQSGSSSFEALLRNFPIVKGGENLRYSAVDRVCMRPSMSCLGVSRVSGVLVGRSASR